MGIRSQQGGRLLIADQDQRLMAPPIRIHQQAWATPYPTMRYETLLPPAVAVNAVEQLLRIVIVQGVVIRQHPVVAVVLLTNQVVLPVVQRLNVM